jgi:chain length determinant protein EpsF
MNVKQVLLILRARYKVALMLLLVIVGSALPVIEHLPRQYTAAVSLVIDIRSPDPISAMLRPSNMATQEDIIRSDRVAQHVVKLLKLEENPTARDQWREITGGKGRLEAWLMELLQKKLAVTPPRRDSNILTIEYTAADAQFAAAVANAFAQAYMEVAVELKVEPAKRYALWFSEQGKQQRENLERAQARLSEFQQRRGIVATDERMDTEAARLGELTGQLTVLQAQTGDSRAKQRSGADTLPEVLQNSVIAGLRTEINRQEARLRDASGNLGKNHPRYRAMELELAEMKARLEAETRHVLKGYRTSTSVGTEKENELKASIEAQKKKILRMRSERDQLAVLQRDVDAAKNAYDAVANRYTQVNLESQATQTNVYLLTPAVEPLEPSSPKVPRLVLMAVLLGVAAGLGAAFGLEFVDRRVRSADDLAQMLHLPVLTTVPALPRRRRRSLRFWRRPALPAP